MCAIAYTRQQKAKKQRKRIGSGGVTTELKGSLRRLWRKFAMSTLEFGIKTCLVCRAVISPWIQALGVLTMLVIISLSMYYSLIIRSSVVK